MFNSFNKKETDFASLQEYNDYLEEVEKISKLADIGYIELQTHCV